MQANPLKFIDDLKNKGVGYGWNVRLPASPGKVLNRQFLTRDHGSHEEALRCALAYRDEMCQSLPFPLHARVSQYLDGTHKAIQAYRATGKLKVRAQWVEFDPSAGADRTRNLYRIVPKPEDYAAVYAKVDALARPRIIREAERVAALAAAEFIPGRERNASAPTAALVNVMTRWQGREPVTPIPAELNEVVARCKVMFDGFEGGSLEELALLLNQVLVELPVRRVSGPKKGKGPGPTEVDTGPRGASRRGRGGISPSSAIRQTGTR